MGYEWQQPRAKSGLIEALGALGAIAMIFGLLFLSRIEHDPTLGMFGLVFTLLGGQAGIASLVALALRR